MNHPNELPQSLPSPDPRSQGSRPLFPMWWLLFLLPIFGFLAFPTHAAVVAVVETMIFAAVCIGLAEFYGYAVRFVAIGAIAGALVALFGQDPFLPSLTRMPLYPLAHGVACVGGGAAAGYFAHRWGSMFLARRAKRRAGRDA